MPKLKLSLTRLEKDKHLACLQKLQAEGHAIEIPEEIFALR